MRHYEPSDTADPKKPKFNVVDTTPSLLHLACYSIPLSELCPELARFRYIDSKLLGGSGLEISFTLAPPQNCMQIVPRDGDGDALTTVAGTPNSFDANISYKISEYYLAIPHYVKHNDAIPMGLQSYQPISYSSYMYTSTPVINGASTISHQFSVGHKAHCFGTFVCFAPTSLSSVSDGSSSNLAVNYTMDFVSTELNKISRNYLYPLRYNSVTL